MNSQMKLITQKTSLFFVLSIVFFMLSGCGSDAKEIILPSTSRASAEIPDGLQKLIATNGTLRAYVTLDNDVANRIQMNINPIGAGSASVSIGALERRLYRVKITYEYTNSNNVTIILATASDIIDLTSGSGALNFTADSYNLDYDKDGDGANNASELLAGANPVIAAKPLVAAPVDLQFKGIKTFQFSWNDVGDATYYQLLEKVEGGAGFVLVSERISSAKQIFDFIVPLYARVNAQYILQSCNVEGCVDSDLVTVTDSLVGSIGYLKASNTGELDSFGISVSLSGDGKTLAVAAGREASNGLGDNPQNDNSAAGTGAVYVFVSETGVWRQQAYIKADNAQAGDEFGGVDLSGDGNTLIVSATGEDSQSTEINTGQSDNNALNAGAVYVFVRNTDNWMQQAYLKASNAEAGDSFGSSISISGDGNTLAVGARGEDSNSVASDLIKIQSDNSAIGSGAVYVFKRNNNIWQQQSYLKASNTDSGDSFGNELSLSDSGLVLAVSANLEDSDIVLNGDPRIVENAVTDAGAVYVFTFSTLDGWSQQSYLKAGNLDIGDQFGRSVSLSADGSVLAISAVNEDSGIVADPLNNAVDAAGAVYVFTRTANEWNETAYIKASNLDLGDQFGQSVSLSNDGNILSVGAHLENSNARNINGDEASNDSVNSGAVYIFDRRINWQQKSYIKATDTVAGDFFGFSVSLSGDGNTLAVGAFFEGNNAVGINPLQNRNPQLTISGAVYLY